MLQKSKSKNIAKIKYLAILPLMLVMLTVVSCSQEFPAQQESELTLSKQLDMLKLKIEESDEITTEEKEKIIKITMAAIEKSENASGNINNKKGTVSGTDVAFGLIDQVPLFPSCENLLGNEAQKKCMSEKIQEHVQENFNANMGKELGLTGTNRVIVQFKINKEGNVVDAIARAPYPELEVEALRVINLLPQMIPGKQDGQEVGVMYSLPIVFQVD